MTDKQKLALKVVMFFTFPAWFPVLILACLAALPFLLIWTMVEEIVDPTPRYPNRKRSV